MTVALAEPQFRTRCSVPAQGTTLVSITEVRALHVRRAIESVRRCLEDLDPEGSVQFELLASRWRWEPLARSESLSLRAAWWLVSMRILGRSIGILSSTASLRDAESWFLGQIHPPSFLSDIVSEFTDREAVRELERVPYDDTLRDLLPYVLDAHGPGSRASVIKNPSTRHSRRTKKAAGIFYTPSDVADYITREVFGALGQEAKSPRFLDPACGSGVFLRAILDFAIAQVPGLDRFDFVEQNIYGIDTSPMAVEAACFVLLHECLNSDNRQQSDSPWSLWHRIRCNLCVADALSIQLRLPSEDRSGALNGLRKTLGESYLPPSNDRSEETTPLFFSESSALGALFPDLVHGADAVIGNPPYASIVSSIANVCLEQRFASLPANCTTKPNYFPLFVEMMWQLTKPSCSSSGMVVPLSIAYSGRKQMTLLRRAIMSSGGRWRFAFFDREPHALFGEEVKTRTAIIFHKKSTDTNCAVPTIETGPLRKWTSRQRAQLFNTVSFTPLNTSSIVAGIPKLSGNEAVDVYGQIVGQTTLLRHMCVSVGSCRPRDACSAHQDNCVFVSGTAYNFLNTFRPPRMLPPSYAPWSSSKLIDLRFLTEGEAARAFAIISSRVAFWLWRVTGDGFHVTHSFVRNLPLSDALLNRTEKDTLANLGARLWDDVQKEQVISINGGRQTVSYRPYVSGAIRDEIDVLLLKALNVAPTFVEHLRRFTSAVLTVDESDPTRKRFFGQFVGGKI